MKRHRFLVLAAAFAMLVATTLASNQAHARNGRVAAGVIGGLAIGALIGSAFAHPPYGYPHYGYYGGYEGPVYYYPPPYYAYYPRCHWERRPVWDGFRWRRARVRVCY